jgi:hypothetical protein
VADPTNSIYDRAMDLEAGTVGTVLPYQRGHILLKNDGIEAPRPKRFIEARAEVIGDYQKQLEDAWVKRLRERYNVRVFPERLNRVFASPVNGTDSAVSPSGQ